LKDLGRRVTEWAERPVRATDQPKPQELTRAGQ
jgi:hypothetical protein